MAPHQRERLGIGPRVADERMRQEEADGPPPLLGEEGRAAVSSSASRGSQLKRRLRPGEAAAHRRLLDRQGERRQGEPAGRRLDLRERSRSSAGSRARRRRPSRLRASRRPPRRRRDGEELIEEREEEGEFVRRQRRQIGERQRTAAGEADQRRGLRLSLRGGGARRGAASPGSGRRSAPSGRGRCCGPCSASAGAMGTGGASHQLDAGPDQVGILLEPAEVPGAEEAEQRPGRAGAPGPLRPAPRPGGRTSRPGAAGRRRG